jgi:hypothetical protein
MCSENWKTTAYNSWLPPPHLKKLNNSHASATGLWHTLQAPGNRPVQPELLWGREHARTFDQARK